MRKRWKRPVNWSAWQRWTPPPWLLVLCTLWVVALGAWLWMQSSELARTSRFGSYRFCHLSFALTSSEAQTVLTAWGPSHWPDLYALIWLGWSWTLALTVLLWRGVSWLREVARGRPDLETLLDWTTYAAFFVPLLESKQALWSTIMVMKVQGDSAADLGPWAFLVTLSASLKVSAWAAHAVLGLAFISNGPNSASMGWSIRLSAVPGRRGMLVVSLVVLTLVTGTTHGSWAPGLSFGLLTCVVLGILAPLGATSMPSLELEVSRVKIPKERGAVSGRRQLPDLAAGILPLVWVPSGKFRLGSRRGKKGWFGGERSLKGVEVGGLWVSEVEVTREAWRRVMEWEPTDWRRDSDADQEGRLPANRVSWLEATLLCNALSEAEGLEVCYEFGEHVAEKGESWETIAESVLGDRKWAEILMQVNPGFVVGDLKEGLRLRLPLVVWNRAADGYRLPTEVEWEFAARGGTATRFPWGEEKERLNEYAWWGGNAEGRVHGVGELKANGYGLKDMIGNVLEWCWDAYDDEGYEVRGRDGAPLSRRVLRGGSCVVVVPGDLRPACQDWDEPHRRNAVFGVRCVRSPRREI